MKKIMQIMFFILFVGTTVFIFANSMRSGDESGKASQLFVDFFSNMIIRFGYTPTENLSYIVRKMAHFSEFALQSGLLACCFVTGRRYFPSCIIYVMFTGLFSACTDELIQMFFIGRGSMVSDVFIDFAGTCTALFIVFVFWFLFRRKTKHLFSK